jgi:hypothetical protein
MNTTIDTTQVSLDDTLHAIVQLTHEFGLPLSGAQVTAGDVQVFCDQAADVLPWADWLAQATRLRMVAWVKDDQVKVHVSGTREGIEWSVCESVPRPADPTVQLDDKHRPLSLSVLAALLGGGAA